MLVAGGLLDQPIGLWFAAQHARYVWHWCEVIHEKGEFDALDQARSKGDAELITEIQKVRTRVAMEKAQ